MFFYIYLNSFQVLTMRKVFTKCVECRTSSCLIKQYANSSWIKILEEHNQMAFYKEGQHIVYENNPVMGLYFIQSGKAKIYSTGINNKMQVVRLTKTGGIIGHRGYGGDLYPVGAIAIEDSVVCFIDNETMYNAFIENPKLTFNLMMYYSKELRNSEAKIKNIAQMNVKEKVVDALLYVDDVFNPASDTHKIISLTRKDLSDLAGINPEQLSRILSELKNEELISIVSNEINIIDIDKLRDFVSPFNRTY